MKFIVKNVKGYHENNKLIKIIKKIEQNIKNFKESIYIASFLTHTTRVLPDKSLKKFMFSYPYLIKVLQLFFLTVTNFHKNYTIRF